MLFEADASFGLATQTLSTFGIGSKKQPDSSIHSILQRAPCTQEKLSKLVLNQPAFSNDRYVRLHAGPWWHQCCVQSSIGGAAKTLRRCCSTKEEDGCAARFFYRPF